MMLSFFILSWYYTEQELKLHCYIYSHAINDTHQISAVIKIVTSRPLEYVSQIPMREEIKFFATIAINKLRSKGIAILCNGRRPKIYFTLLVYKWYFNWYYDLSIGYNIDNATNCNYDKSSTFYRISLLICQKWRTFINHDKVLSAGPGPCNAMRKYYLKSRKLHLPDQAI